MVIFLKNKIEIFQNNLTIFFSTDPATNGNHIAGGFSAVHLAEFCRDAKRAAAESSDVVGSAARLVDSDDDVCRAAPVLTRSRYVAYTE